VYLYVAKLVRVVELKNGPLNSFVLDNGDKFSIDGSFQLTLHPMAPLIGALPRKYVKVSVASAGPTVGSTYYVLAKTESGKREVIWRGMTAEGLCLDMDTAEEYHIAAEVKRLQKSLPCK
jgi:hypothetical protein